MFKITVCRVGVGQNYVATDKTMMQAWRKMQRLVSVPYRTGISAGDGHSFGPDLTQDFLDGFASCRLRMSHQRNCPRTGWRNAHRTAEVEILRV